MEKKNFKFFKIFLKAQDIMDFKNNLQYQSQWYYDNKSSFISAINLNEVNNDFSSITFHNITNSQHEENKKTLNQLLSTENWPKINVNTHHSMIQKEVSPSSKPIKKQYNLTHDEANYFENMNNDFADLSNSQINRLIEQNNTSKPFSRSEKFNKSNINATINVMKELNTSKIVQQTYQNNIVSGRSSSNIIQHKHQNVTTKSTAIEQESINRRQQSL